MIPPETASQSLPDGMSQSISAGEMVQRLVRPGRPVTVNQPERPLLARVADSIYWLGRYMERAEHVARLMLINSHLLMDLGDLTPALVTRQWQDLLQVMHLPPEVPGEGDFEGCVTHYMVLDPANPNSLLSCIAHGRENARAIRSDISAEMWESVNELYWSTQGPEIEAQLNENAEGLYDNIVSASMRFQGITDQTLGHDQRWHFVQLAKFLERIDVTCRLLETRLAFLLEYDEQLERPIRNIHLMTALRMCCSIEAFRRQPASDLDLLPVVAFLVLERNHPRSLRFCVREARLAAQAVRLSTRGHTGTVDPAEKALGRLEAQLEYADARDIRDAGPGEYLRNIREAADAAGSAVRRRYFLE